jgi:polar amino acid transport system substrate-binding protein
MLLVAFLAVATAGCGVADSDVGNRAIKGIPLAPTTTVAPTTTTIGACTETTPAQPTADQVAAEVARIRRDGLWFGIDENTEGLGFRNPRTGALSGFEIALAKEIVRRITGDEQLARFQTVVTANKVSAVVDEDVDATLSSVSMNCERRKQVDFSREYFTAYHELLVRNGAGIGSAADLPRKRVCMTAGSSSIKLLADIAPTARPVIVPTRSECLVELQRGRADAYLGHDTFLWGLHDQDLKHTTLIDQNLGTQRYGIAISKERPGLRELIDGVLTDMCTDGSLQQLADDNLGNLWPARRTVPCGSGSAS